MMADESLPPIRTTFDPYDVMPKNSRALGWWAGVSCVHAEPSQLHVSDRKPALLRPPKSTSVEPTAARPAPQRFGGEVPTVGDCQVEPVHTQVSA